MKALPYVRSEGGLATVFGGGKTSLNVLWVSAFLVVAGWISLNGIGLAACLFSLIGAVLFSLYCFWKIGGYTGDTLGALCEITEIVPPLVAVIWSGIFI
jgi:adenosylcobinamide-GDP ribazoletransferase